MCSPSNTTQTNKWHGTNWNSNGESAEWCTLALAHEGTVFDLLNRFYCFDCFCGHGLGLARATNDGHHPIETHRQACSSVVSKHSTNAGTHWNVGREVRAREWHFAGHTDCVRTCCARYRLHSLRRLARSGIVVLVCRYIHWPHQHSHRDKVVWKSTSTCKVQGQ